ncbi:uncharacterized protein LOC135215151 [Macrobrachium nipponense]|uniref:uncharacterized protein LOC135215151 n=1 Tax=Macrobrachium nipponense TaxID=159736 RepID=UPI0030C880EE
MANEKVDDCQLCCENYDKTRRPRSLLCGHSYCTECLDKLLQNETCSCPICNASIKASSVSDFSINYALESAISELRDLEFAEMLKSLPKGRQSRLREMIGHHRTCSRELLDSAREMSGDLDNYIEFLLENKGRHAKLAVELEERSEWHNEIIQDIKKERTKVKEDREKVKDHIEKLEAALPQLDKVVDLTETTDAVSKATLIFGELADLVDKCKKDYPDPTIANAQKLLRSSDNLYEEEEEESYFFNVHGFPETFNIADRLAITVSEEYVYDSHPKKAPEEWKKKMKTGKVFASDCGENVRHARISVTEDQVYLHCLEDGRPPELSFEIQHIEVMTLVKKPKVVFLDIAWDNVPKGRVHIQLNAGSALAEHFLSLCTGKLGPTYVNRKLNDVVYPQTQTERIGSQVYGGSFIEGKVALEDKDFYGSVNSRYACEGIVWMEKDYSFYVLTGIGRDCTYNRVFGQVTQGLKILADSVKKILLNDVEVEIIDTGVVLDF